MRSVAIRPGKTTLAVMPSLATSRARVFDHPTNDSRNAFEIARLGIGETTPEDVPVMILPHRRAFIPGRTRSAIEITESTIIWKLRSHKSGLCPAAGVGGGPPVLAIKISTG